MSSPAFTASSTPRPNRHLPLGIFALAQIGGVIAYLPLLALLLPIKVESINPGGRIGLLAMIAMSGAVMAGAANILFGWLSDRSQQAGKGRRRWMAAGIVAIGASYAGVAWAATPGMLVLAILFFQLAVNALLAPMQAIFAEEIPDSKRGMAGGLIALGPPAASALSAALVGMTALAEPERLAIIFAMVLLCTLPLLLTPSRIAGNTEPDRSPAEPLRRDFLVTSASRLLIQVAAVVTQAYLLYYFETIVPRDAQGALPGWIGQVFTLAFIVPLPVALVLGRLADRPGRRRTVLLISAMVAAAGLFAMGGAQDRWGGAAAFILYSVGSSVFLALHAGLALQLLPDPRHRGRDLGLFNLTNTAPSLIGGGLALAFATPHDFGVILAAVGGMTVLGGIAILGVRAWR